MSSYESILARSLILDAGTRFGSVAFVKRDGTLRHLTFQQARDNTHRVLGTERGERASMTFALNNPTMMRLWDHHKRAWRTVALDRVLSVRVGGKTHRLRRAYRLGDTVMLVPDRRDLEASS
jgi:hypothetical protein